MTKNLNQENWKLFHIDELFNVKRPTPRSKDNYQAGSVPFVASGAVNNGVIKCCMPQASENIDKANCITVSPVDGSAFYQPYDFLGRGGAGSSVLMLYSADNEKSSGQFVAKMISKACVKYSYGHMGNQNSLKREAVQLPVTDTGKPDYEYMEQYVSAKNEILLSRYKAFVEKQLSNLEHKHIPELCEKEWKPIAIPNLFLTFMPGKGKGLNHLCKVKNGGVNYIGATNRENGVLCYVEDSSIANKMVMAGNCIGFIKNGDGAAGFAIYKVESFISTSDIIYGYADWLNKYTGLFFVATQDMIEHKYSHGYKRNRQHLAGDKVMLPVNDDGKPDYEYMEQYSKNMMFKKYKQYLSFLNHNRK